eukprot:m.18058 g.18058  ORF g.18058 m.18058 type:complete len:275 (-) comp10743_c0_seq1:38-862(-)
MTSIISLYTLDTSTTDDIFVTDSLIEAPNWTPDGTALIVNGQGKLWRIPLDEPSLQPIDTGHLAKLNNDHGITPDGMTYAVTDKTETGKSCIYTLPTNGGPATRITQSVPSYWHGISPDGGTHIYCGFRDDVINIFTTPFEGGAERALTSGPGHKDGPDITPDGTWVWFNGDMSGSMNLWRVRMDGSGLEMMTNDEHVNWFPHPSPCGEHILYLAYPPGTQGHPRNLDVELRIMPAAGGSSRTVVKLFGGQGTINVPCWSPDGSRFAFMRYEAQ